MAILMRSVLFISFLVGSAFSYSEEAMEIGNVNNLPDIDDQVYDKMNKANEYYDALLKLIQKQQEVQNAQMGGNSQVVNTERYAPEGRGRDSGVPRHLRGTEEGDYYIDSEGKRVTKEARPVAYITTVSGMSANLTAEVVWGDRSIPVKKGDSLVGGAFEVVSVNRDHMIISGRGQRLKIGMLPVYIDELMELVQ